MRIWHMALSTDHGPVMPVIPAAPSSKHQQQQAQQCVRGIYCGGWRRCACLDAERGAAGWFCDSAVVL
jgi:hypothetical protein